MVGCWLPGSLPGSISRLFIGVKLAKKRTAGHSVPLPVVCCKTYAISVKYAIKHTKKLVLRQENAYEFGVKESLPLYLRRRKGVNGSCEKTLPFGQGGARR